MYENPPLFFLCHEVWLHSSLFILFLTIPKRVPKYFTLIKGCAFLQLLMSCSLLLICCYFIYSCSSPLQLCLISCYLCYFSSISQSYLERTTVMSAIFVFHAILHSRCTYFILCAWNIDAHHWFSLQEVNFTSYSWSFQPLEIHLLIKTFIPFSCSLNPEKMHL